MTDKDLRIQENYFFPLKFMLSIKSFLFFLGHGGASYNTSTQVAQAGK
jgi:hypothetical protein